MNGAGRISLKNQAQRYIVILSDFPPQLNVHRRDAPRCQPPAQREDLKTSELYSGHPHGVGDNRPARLLPGGSYNIRCRSAPLKIQLKFNIRLY